jgi:putative flippase GtrA
MSIPARQLLRYVVAGGTATVVGLCLLAALVKLLAMRATLARAI